MISKNHSTIKSKLVKKNGWYHASYSFIGQDQKTKEIWRTTEIEAKPGNKRKAERRMEEIKTELQGVINVPGYQILFVDFLNKWIKKKEAEVRENTYLSDNHAVKKIITHFEKLKLRLSEVKPIHIKKFYEYLFKCGRSDGKGGLSISTIKSYKSILNEAFKYAVINDLLIVNPVESVKLPAKDNPRKEHNVLNQEQANHLLGHVINDRLMYPLLLLTLRYGLRHSEVIGLKWSAINYSNGTIRIETTITKGKNPEQNKTKTETSKHTFPLLDDVKEALIIRKNAQNDYRKQYGSGYTETEYVFTHNDGRLLSQKFVRKRFERILSECGLPYMRFHDLRHSTASILFSHNMRIMELKDWMRHGKIEMTADVYLHISKEKEKGLAEGLKNIFNDDTDQYNSLIKLIVNE